jgi:MoaA/NifB/PqqE/SkfB family radical SAM enzyme
MSMETFSRLEPAFESTDLVFLQGWGEPLVHPGLWGFVRRTRAAGSRVGFTTNGVLLDGKERRAALESGLDVLGISLAGATSGTHDRFREGNSLETVDLHLTRLREEKQGLGSEKPHVHVAFLLLASNVHELPAVLDLAQKWGASQVVVSGLDLVLDPSLEEEALDSRPDLRPEVEARLHEARERAEALGMVLEANVVDPEGALLSCPENVLRSCFVSADGRVSPCVMAGTGVGADLGATQWIGGRSYPLESVVFGNIRERPLEEIWRSRAARKFRGIFRDRIWKGGGASEELPRICRQCRKLGMNGSRA